MAIGLALCAAPASIAISELLLSAALAARIAVIAFSRTRLWVPRIFWLWLPLAALEITSWIASPDFAAGLGEMKHLLLLAALFVTLPALDRPRHSVAVWCGILATATLSSGVLIAEFASRLAYFRRQISRSADPSLYVRNGGLLHHWMVYGTVEIFVFAGLLAGWDFFPRRRRWLVAALGINSLAILLSLTRMLWIACFVMLILHLVWQRYKWTWTVPLAALVPLVLAPGVVHARIAESFQPDFYSNAERVQMLRVGWKMIVDRPFAGVGPGRVESTYQSYLSPGDLVPAYHGHLHNNVAQLAAEFGLPAAAAALALLVFLLNDLRKKRALPFDCELEFLRRSALLGITGFLIAGMFEYTYGHSLGLIALAFATLAPLCCRAESGR